MQFDIHILFVGGKAAGVQIYQSPPSDAGVKVMWSSFRAFIIIIIIIIIIKIRPTSHGTDANGYIVFCRKKR
jgi:hypothetical protein